jgi:hypothetical protein
MRKLVGLLALVLLATVSALAQNDSKLDVFGGYSYLHVPATASPSQNTNGWEAQATINLTKYLGVTADFDGHYGDVFRMGGYDNNFLFDPTIFHRHDKVTGFAHLLFGGSRAGAHGFSETAFAWAIGGGVDWNLKKRLAIRLGQFDYLPTYFGSTTQNNFRYSAGVVFRLGSD